MTKSFFADRATLMSPRTAKYVEAMVHEGFDYYEWLKEIREEEAQAKQAPTAISPHNVVAARVDNPIKISVGRGVTPSLGPALIGKPALNLRALRRLHRQAESQTKKARLTRWLEKAHCASGKFQGSRRRDAVYAYLEAVFAIVEHYRVRRRTNRLLRHAFKFANLPFDKNADSFGAVIRCTSGRKVDGKIVSKYARALRYASRRKEPDMPLKTFMKEAGGVNACAARYARYYGRCVRQISPG
jgi:hypothetical protein